MLKKMIFLFLSFALVGSIVYACGGGGEGGNGDDDNPFSVLIRLAKDIQSGKIAFIPKEELEARERRRAEIRKMQAEEEKKAELFRKAGNIFDTSVKVATAINIGAGLGLGAVAVPGAALGVGGLALTEAGAAAVGMAYTAASAKVSGDSATNAVLRGKAIDFIFPNSHAVVKAAIDYTASNVDFNSKTKSDANTNTNVYNSKAYQDAMATHSQPGITMRYGGM